jgi:hypothetical protein
MIPFLMALLWSVALVYASDLQIKEDCEDKSDTDCAEE